MQLIRINWVAAAGIAWLWGTARATPDAATHLHIDARVSQHGSQSGITNTAFTAWLPPGTGFGGLTGQLSLSGSSVGFSEALVLVGIMGDSQGGCTRLNQTASASIPAMTRLWVGILKSNDTSPVALPVNFTLPHAVPAPLRGACLITLISAGYPYLDPSTARYTTTAAALDVVAAKVRSPAPTVIPVGIGGEFRIPLGGASPLGTYVGIRAARALALDAIAVSVSAAPVVGAPNDGRWAPVPAAAWLATADFTYMPAAVCAAGHFSAQPANSVLSVLRNATPAALARPAGAVTLIQTSLPSSGAAAVQRGAFQIFPSPHSGLFTGKLAPGDCLIAYDSAVSAANRGAGILNMENQSTLYLRPVP